VFARESLRDIRGPRCASPRARLRCSPSWLLPASGLDSWSGRCSRKAMLIARLGRRVTGSRRPASRFLRCLCLARPSPRPRCARGRDPVRRSRLRPETLRRAALRAPSPVAPHRAPRRARRRPAPRRTARKGLRTNLKRHRRNSRRPHTTKQKVCITKKEEEPRGERCTRCSGRSAADPIAEPLQLGERQRE
jgi:hypothetical protein